jgi:hypothetical protein
LSSKIRRGPTTIVEADTAREVSAAPGKLHHGPAQQAGASLPVHLRASVLGEVVGVVLYVCTPELGIELHPRA